MKRLEEIKKRLARVRNALDLQEGLIYFPNDIAWLIKENERLYKTLNASKKILSLFDHPTSKCSVCAVVAKELSASEEQKKGGE